MTVDNAALPAGLRAVVTGGGSGLGEALCQRLVAADAQVVVADIDEARAQTVAQQLRRDGGVAYPVGVDVGDPEQMAALAVKSEELMGGVDLLVNNAGVAVGGRFEALSLADWRWIVDVNLWGVVHGCHAFLPYLTKATAAAKGGTGAGGSAQRRGYIINVASAAGLISFPEMSPYNTTKAAVVALSETLYAEYRDRGINVTVLCPTFFRTRILEAGRGTIDEQRRGMVHTLMDRAEMQAPEVAQFALNKVAAGELYALPMRDGRLLWRAWRAAPGRVQRLLAGGSALLSGRANRFLSWLR